MDTTEDILDDRGATQEDARGLIGKLLEAGFDGEIDLLAQALGRPTESIYGAINGDEIIDEDLLMKVRNLAKARNLDI